MAQPLTLSAHALACVRGGRKIFSNLDFSVLSGHALVITGPNGAGKSSLLGIIAGLIRAENGTVSLSGGDSALTLPERTHFLGHRDALKPSLSVLENLAFWATFLGGDGSAAKPSAALDAVGLGGLGHLPAGVLSAGQKRRLALARLLAVRRPLWLLDEPTTALDQAARVTVAGLMTAHLRDGGLIVAATHQPLGIDASELRLGAKP